MAAKLIILRHGEKPKKGVKTSLYLDPKGVARAQFLAEMYLGRNAKASLLGREAPHAFFAVTPHTIETASPSAESWGLPVTAFCTQAKEQAKEIALDRRTQQAAKAIRRALERDRTVVVVWEHHRIVDAAFRPETTLRKLLNLAPPGLHETWPDDDYDTIWIVECDSDGKPKPLEAVSQQFVYPQRKARTAKKAPSKAKAKAKVAVEKLKAKKPKAKKSKAKPKAKKPKAGTAKRERP